MDEHRAVAIGGISVLNLLLIGLLGHLDHKIESWRSFPRRSRHPFFGNYLSTGEHYRSLIKDLSNTKYGYEKCKIDDQFWFYITNEKVLQFLIKEPVEENSNNPPNKEILKDPPYEFQSLKKGCRRSILFSSRENFRQHHEWVSPSLSMDNIRKFQPDIQKYTLKMLSGLTSAIPRRSVLVVPEVPPDAPSTSSAIRTASDADSQAVIDSNAIDIQPYISRCVLNILLKTLFGIELDNADTSVEFDRFCKAVDTINQNMPEAHFGSIYSWYNRLCFNRELNYLRKFTIRRCRAMLNEINVKRRNTSINHDEYINDNKCSLMESLIHQMLDQTKTNVDGRNTRTIFSTIRRWFRRQFRTIEPEIPSTTASETGGVVRRSRYFSLGSSMQDDDDDDDDEEGSNPPPEQKISDAPYVHKLRDAPYEHKLRDAPYEHKLRDAPYEHKLRDAPYEHKLRDAPRMLPTDSEETSTQTSSVVEPQPPIQTTADFHQTYGSSSLNTEHKNESDNASNKTDCPSNVLDPSPNGNPPTCQMSSSSMSSLSNNDDVKKHALQSDQPVASPSDEPAAPPSGEPVAPPSDEPVAPPSDEPVAPPSDEPVAPPSDEPVAPPSDEPVAPPSDEPVAPPSDEPVAPPSDEPAAPPSDEPAAPPSDEPAAPPSDEPAAPPSDEPAAPPSGEPVEPPSGEPAAPPSGEPAAPPSGEPVEPPSDEPAAPPSDEPAAPPSGEPVEPPSGEPVEPPSDEPAAPPSGEPAAPPSGEPAAPPSGEPVAPPPGEPVAPPSDEPVAPHAVGPNAPTGEVMAIDLDLIADEVLAFFLTGHMSTTMAVYWSILKTAFNDTLFASASISDIEKAPESIFDIDAINQRIPSVEELINSGMKCFPPIPFSIRKLSENLVVERDGTAPVDHPDRLETVNKGTFVAVSTKTIHEKSFSKIQSTTTSGRVSETSNAPTITPLDGIKEFHQQYLRSFSIGSRKCPGEQLATVIARILTTNILHKFNVRSKGTVSMANVHYSGDIFMVPVENPAMPTLHKITLVEKVMPTPSSPKPSTSRAN